MKPEVIEFRQYECPVCSKVWEEREPAQACLEKHEADKVDVSDMVGQTVRWLEDVPGHDHGKPTTWPTTYEGRVVSVEQDVGAAYEPRLLVEVERGVRKLVTLDKVAAQERLDKEKELRITERGRQTLDHQPDVDWANMAVLCSSAMPKSFALSTAPEKPDGPAGGVTNQSAQEKGGPSACRPKGG